MILDTLPGFSSEQMKAVFKRRLAYLVHRTEQLSQEIPGDGRGGDASWRSPVVRATLHLEVAEASAVVGEIGQTRVHIDLATSLFLDAQLPYGLALHRAFAAAPQRAQTVERLTEIWEARFEARQRAVAHEERERRDGVRTDPDKTPSDSSSQQEETPSQWAYVGLARALSDRRSRRPLDYWSRVCRDWWLVPVGRLRFPMEQYLFVIDYCHNSNPRELSEEARTAEVVSALAKQLVAVLRAIQYASVNEYLWSRVLAPVPWFDLDVAMLIAAVMSSSRVEAKVITEQFRAAMPGEHEATFAAEYLTAVQALTSRNR